MQRKLVVLALICVLGASGCRMAGPQRRPEPAPVPAPSGPVPGVPAPAPGAPAPAPPDPGVPDLEGGPEDGQRPHFDPPKPPPGAYLRGDRRHRLVALTFDDGPDSLYTPQVLNVLKKNGAKATFYLVGKRAAARPDLVKRIVAEGHEIGNHTWNHPSLTKISPARMHKELADTHQLLRRVSGKPVRTFRPPYGALNPAVLKQAGALGYKTVLWNVDSLDWKKGKTRDDVVHNVTPSVRNGSIILQHSAGGKGEDLSNTVQALPLIIKTLRGQGYRLVTVSEMLATGKVVAGQW